MLRLKTKMVVAVVAVIAIIIAAGFAGLYFTTYNNLVNLNVTVDEKWAQIDQELQRRYDLIPNVVNAAKAYMTYEGSVLENVTRLRAQWDDAVASGNVDEIGNATDALESGVSQLIINVEAYPDLKASSVVQSLIIELEGTENRISTERMRYNQAVGSYNTAIKVFPANMWATGWGFESRAFFEAQVNAYTAPQVNL
jgi:LemA protein